jgi:D-alanyl-D-alanine-carboxypeptidase/D-alanyl-D-alanine-endopeptidase
MALRRTLLWFLVAATACTQAPQPAQLAREPEIRGILEDRIDRYRQSVGIVVGLIEPQGRRVIAYGKLDQADSRPLNGDTVFEIASITKLLTALALAEMVQRGDVKLTDPVAKYLTGVKVPERGGHQITLEDLATHTSGLPREPSNLKARSVYDPWAGYSFEDLSEFLSSYQLSRDPGGRFEYSNLGVALLGTALARRAGVNYEALIRKLITGPLGMASTAVTPTQEMAARLSAGHNYLLEPDPATKSNIFAPAGALRSTVNDLLKLLSAVLGYTQTPLAPAIRATLAVHRPMAPLMARLVAVVAGGTGGDQIHLGWSSTREKGVEVVWHSGAVPGFRSFIGFDRGMRRGVVVLSNAGNSGVDDIGMHLLNPRVPLKGANELKPPSERREIAFDAKLIDDYVGRYRFSKDDVVTVTRDGDQLVMVDDEASRDPYYPERSLTFFSRSTDSQVTFKVDRQGLAFELMFHFGDGRTKLYKRIQ